MLVPYLAYSLALRGQILLKRLLTFNGQHGIIYQKIKILTMFFFMYDFVATYLNLGEVRKLYVKIAFPTIVPAKRTFFWSVTPCSHIEVH
jgi:hypothetical protein